MCFFLKYATTGECPPGTTKGQTFVHDPHMTKGKRESAGKFSYILDMMEVQCTLDIATGLRHGG